MPRIAVIMATWNGMTFLPELLRSLERQTLPPDELLIADDGSTDGTRFLLAAWAETAPFHVRLLPIHSSRLGPAQTFARLLAIVDADLVLPCDQDDIWHPGKIAACTILPIDGTPRLLVHDLRVTDAEGRSIHPSFWDYQGFQPRHGSLIGTLVAMNSFPGCAMAMNRSLIDRLLPVPVEAVMHDWWCALVAASIGRIHILPQALIDYRQHTMNAVGAVRGDLRALAQRLLRPWSTDYRRTTDASRRQARALAFRLGKAAPKAVRWWAVASHMPPIRRRWAMLRAGIGKTGTLRWLALLIRA